MFISVSLGPTITFAHPGRTDALGCHTCKTNCPNWGLSYGEYHCHRVKALPQPKAPIKSKFGENGTGYTQPAPEYQNQSTTTPKNTNEPKTVASEVTKQQSKGGFWQWLYDIFK